MELFLCLSGSIWSSYQEINPVDALSVQSEKAPPHFPSHSLHHSRTPVTSNVPAPLPLQHRVTASLISSLVPLKSMSVRVSVCVCAQRSSCPQQMETFTELGWGGGESGEYGHSPTYSNLRHAEMNVSKTRTQNESSAPQLDISLIHRPPSLQSPGYHMSTLALHRRLSPCHPSPASLADLQRTGQLRWTRGRGRSGQNGK